MLSEKRDFVLSGAKAQKGARSCSGSLVFSWPLVSVLAELAVGSRPRLSRDLDRHGKHVAQRGGLEHMTCMTSLQDSGNLSYSYLDSGLDPRIR